MNGLACLQCGLNPQEIAVIHDGSIIHTKRLDGGKMPRLCGGRVLFMKDAWRARLRPGIVATCYPEGMTSPPHLVRLGSCIDPARNTWTGTALCGGSFLGTGLWIPQGDHEILHSMHEACREAHERRSAPDLEEEANEQDALKGAESP